jgi:hypothetical protein
MLTDTGLGDLKLGMSLKKAKALGMVGKGGPGLDADSCAEYQGKEGVKTLLFSDDKLLIIDIGPKIRLDTGLGLGSTYGELQRSYGKRLGGDDGMQLAKVYLKAPDAPFKARYRIGLNTSSVFPDSKVTEIALQALDQPCYE